MGIQDEKSSGRLDKPLFVPILELEMEDMLVGTKNKMMTGHFTLAKTRNLSNIVDDPCYPHQNLHIKATKSLILSIGINVTIQCIK